LNRFLLQYFRGNKMKGRINWKGILSLGIIFLLTTSYFWPVSTAQASEGHIIDVWDKIDGDEITIHVKVKDDNPGTNEYRIYLYDAKNNELEKEPDLIWKNLNQEEWTIDFTSAWDPTWDRFSYGGMYHVVLMEQHLGKQDERWIGKTLTTITFNAGVISGNVVDNPKYYEWSFGDGTYTDESEKWDEVHHTYWKAGNYDVDLLIIDQSRNAHNFMISVIVQNNWYGTSGLNKDEKIKLNDAAEEYAPVLMVDPDALNNCPINISKILGNATLKEKDGKIIDESPVSLDNLAAFSGNQYYLDEKDGLSVTDGPTVYIHYRKESGLYFIQYYFIYYYNDGVDNHEGDVESIQISFDSNYQPIRATYSQHTDLLPFNFNWGEKRNWENVEKYIDGNIITNHPIVYVSSGTGVHGEANSHANYFYRGDDPYTDYTDSCTESIAPMGTSSANRQYKLVILPNLEDDLLYNFKWLQFAGNWGECGPLVFDGPPGPAFGTFTNDGNEYRRWVYPYEFEEGRNYDGNHEPISVHVAFPELTIDDVRAEKGETVTLTAYLFGNAEPLTREPVSFYINKKCVGSSLTDELGCAKLNYDTTDLDEGIHRITAVFMGDLPHSPWSWCDREAKLNIHSPIQKGLQWLRYHQNPDGSWGSNVGYTSLAALAFLNYGIDESDSAVSKAINYILSNKHSDGSIYANYQNYETALAILPLVATHNSDYDDEIEAAKNYLVSIQNDESAGIDDTSPWYGGWAYWGLNSGWSDLSNAQWTMAGLDAAGLAKTDGTWSKAEAFVTRCQNLEATNPTYKYSNDGGFAYQPPTVACCGRYISYGSMTAAGIWGLRLAGVPTTDQRIQAGLNWLKNNYAPIATKGNAQNPYYPDWYLYYYLLCYAKALVMTGIPAGSWQEVASSDITNYIVNQQYDDGHWTSSNEGDIFATEQAILALETRTIPMDVQRLSWMTLILHSHADLHVYDPLGRHVGKNYESGGVDIEIPNAIYECNGFEKITVPQLEAGSYRIVLIGKESGDYNLTVTTGVGDNIVRNESYERNIIEGETHETDVDVAMVTWLTVMVDEPENIGSSDETATGAGNFSIVSDKGNIEDLQTYNMPELPFGVPSIEFPYGFFSFNVTGINPGAIVNLTIVLPSNIPAGSQYWKYGCTIDNPAPHWYSIPVLSNNGDNIIVIQLQDGGVGDDDLSANGRIEDVGGPGFEVTKLTVEKQAVPSAVELGGNLTYTITLSNDGDKTLYNIRVKEYYDKNFIPQSFDPMPSEGNNIWRFDSIAPGETKVIEILGKVLDNNETKLMNMIHYYSSNGGHGICTEYTTILYAKPYIERQCISTSHICRWFMKIHPMKRSGTRI